MLVIWEFFADNLTFLSGAWQSLHRQTSPRPISSENLFGFWYCINSTNTSPNLETAMLSAMAIGRARQIKGNRQSMARHEWLGRYWQTMVGAPALLVWPWHYQPVAHRLNQEHGKRRWSWSWRLQTAWRLIHSLPAQRTRSTRVDGNFRISLFWAERWWKYIQPS